MLVRYCSCFLCRFILPFPPLGTTWVKAAEGKTEKASITIRSNNTLSG